MLSRTALVLMCTALTACGEQAGDAPEPQSPEATSNPAPADPTAAVPSPANTPAPTRKPSPPGAMAYIISPTDGAVVTSPVRVVFGLKGAGVAPAGIDQPNTGHHHLLIDTDAPPPDQPIPADERHVHFGAGQTETTVTLTPGEHRLQLLLGDHLHIPHDPPLLSSVVTIRVQ